MLSDLPTEILLQIVSNLPTAASIVNLSLADKALHDKLAANDYAIFRGFVQSVFPSISTPPSWRDAACALTSRSRAWDRKAVIAREVIPPRDDTWTRSLAFGAQLNFGYIPIIDSYAKWTGPRWRDNKEVLAWANFGRLRTRTTENGRVTWSTYRYQDDHQPQNDILDVRILRPHQNLNSSGETFLLRKANREVIKLESHPKEHNFSQVNSYATPSDHVDCMDITSSSSPILAICNTKSIRLYPVKSDEATTQPFDVCSLDLPWKLKSRQRCAKFLNENTLAVAKQFVEGRERSPMDVYSISPAGLTSTPLHSLGASSTDRPKGRHCANAITTLDAVSSLAGRPGEVFLSGWSDGIARLHDLRDPLNCRAEYLDVVDDGQILAMLAIGHERFMAGSHQNACLKIFDLRMTGGRVYDYLDALPSAQHQHIAPTTSPPIPAAPLPARDVQRDINIFLALQLSKSRTLWTPLPSATEASSSTYVLPRYRGSIYSLSSPSPASPTVYAGIENHLIALTSLSSDDALFPSPRTQKLSTILPSNHTPPPSTQNSAGGGDGPILNLSCYERPRPSHASTDAVLLRKQVDWADVAKASADGTFGGKEVEEGWDERWRLATYERLGRRGGRGRWSRPV